MKKVFVMMLGCVLTLAVYGQDSINSDVDVVESALVESSVVDFPAEEADKNLIDIVVDWYRANLNYGNITLLMTVESSFIPFPSEVVIPPAAYVAAEGEESSLKIFDNNYLNIILVILAGTLGAIFGAYINYFLARWLGRPIIYKFADSKLGHMCLLSAEKLEKAEKYFNENGNISTFVGRLIPGIRQLISIPAGVAKMNLGSFTLYTFLGAGIWNTILAIIGFVAHGNSDLIKEYSKELSLGCLAILLLFVAYKLIKNRKKKKNNAL